MFRTELCIESAVRNTQISLDDPSDRTALLPRCSLGLYVSGGFVLFVLSVALGFGETGALPS